MILNQMVEFANLSSLMFRQGIDTPLKTYGIQYHIWIITGPLMAVKTSKSPTLF